MLGPRIDGQHGVVLAPPTREDGLRVVEWQTLPEPTRFWEPRVVDARPARNEERLAELTKARSAIMWSIHAQGEHVGFTGLFDIDWIARDAESGIFIGRADLYGRGIASEAIRLRTRYAFDELRLERVHNWIALRNRGSRRANEKAGYRQMGRLERSWRRSGQWMDEWLGEIRRPEGGV